MSSVGAWLADRAEAFLASAGFDRAPWIAVCFACGILAWFVLKTPWQWASGIGCGVLVALAALALWPPGTLADETRAHIRQALVACGLVFAAGIAVIWARSEMVGAAPIERPAIERVEGYVLERQDQPSDDRIRLTLAVRDASSGQSRKIRVNIALAEVERVNRLYGSELDGEALAEGARL